jgi:hypothetical protein
MATPTPFDDRAHDAALYRAAKPQFAFRGATSSEWRSWRQAFLPELRNALGLPLMETDLADHRPAAERIASEDMETHTRETWRLWVEPAVPLPFYLLRPRGATGRLPLILTPHGHNHPHVYAGIAHTAEEAAWIRDGDRDIAVQAVNEGYLALAPTTRGFGETRTRADRDRDVLCSCRQRLLHGLLVGRTPIGERVWDISRLLDWALAYLDPDPTRIAITGNSGGGTTSLFAAACDERIRVAMPGCYFCTFVGSIGSIHHCDCNYVPGILRLGEMWDVAGLIAPRPFLAIAGESDDIFPIAHVRESFARLQPIYAAAGAPDRCALFVGSGGHRYCKSAAWPFVRRAFEAGTVARDIP